MVIRQTGNSGHRFTAADDHDEDALGGIVARHVMVNPEPCRVQARAHSRLWQVRSRTHAAYDQRIRSPPSARQLYYVHAVSGKELTAAHKAQRARLAAERQALLQQQSEIVQAKSKLAAQPVCPSEAH